MKKAVRKCVKDIFIQEELAIQTPSGGGDRNKMNGLKLRAIAGNLFWYAPGELYFNVTMMLYFLSFRFRFRYSAMPGTSFQREEVVQQMNQEVKKRMKRGDIPSNGSDTDADADEDNVDLDYYIFNTLKYELQSKK